MSWTRFTEIVATNGTLLLAPVSYSQGLRVSPETQSLSLTGTPTGGTFTLTFNNQTTAGIAYNAAASAVASALQALTNIGSLGVACSIGPLPTSNVLISFAGLPGPQALITANGTNLTGGSSPTATVTRIGAGTFETPPTTGAAGAGPAAMIIDQLGIMTAAQLGGPLTLSSMAIAYHAATGTSPANGTLVDVFI